MSSIIKKGTNASSFRLKDGTFIILQPDLLVVLKDEVFNQLMSEYGSFINPRIISEKNPNGCFLVNEKSSYAKDMNKEVGIVKDNSSQIEVTVGEVSKAPAKKRGRKAKK